MNLLEQVLKNDKKVFFLTIIAHFISFPIIITALVNMFKGEVMLEQSRFAHIGLWIMLAATMTIFLYIYSTVITRSFDGKLPDKAYIRKRLQAKIKGHSILLIGGILLMIGLLCYYTYLLSPCSKTLQFVALSCTSIGMLFGILKIQRIQKTQLEKEWKPLLRQLEMEI